MLNTQSVEVEAAVNLLLTTKLIEELAKELDDAAIEEERRLGCRESIGFLTDILNDHILWTAETTLGLSRDELTAEVTAQGATLVQLQHWLVEDCRDAVPEGAAAPLLLRTAA